MRTRVLEICVDTAESLTAAIAGGADRIELCSALALGGLTPQRSLMRLAASAPIPVNAMIRPRAGDFVFERGDFDLMRGDIDDTAEAGLAGVVLGASLPDDRLDAASLRALRAHAADLGLSTTLHRAFDLAPDLNGALECAIDLGFERILTSGGAPRATEGLDRLEGLERTARGRIVLMPGAGIRPDTLPAIVRRLPIEELHASASEAAPKVSARARAFGFAPETSRRTSTQIVAELKEAWRKAE
nr:copper homeostasis protein CutC [Pararhizobium mangrovi]